MDYSFLKDNFIAVEEEIKEACRNAGVFRSDIQLITVTKTKPLELTQAVIDRGYLHIGENRPQEIMDKSPQLVGDYTMHLIGQLQSNKAAKVAPFVDWVHSVDRGKILNKLDTAAAHIEKTINICVQVNTSGEESKSGVAPGEAEALCRAAAEKEHLSLRGLMTIGPLGGSSDDTRRSFSTLRELSESFRDCFDGRRPELSMGMSGDFAAAIAEGATMIRVGSRIVGKRVSQ
ncbi:MAG: YggS family pyridoxal phosphate-dependent enzyme [Fibrobacterota bacterium]